MNVSPIPALHNSARLDVIPSKGSMEIFASSRPQDGRTSNEDAYLIGRGSAPYVALWDGSGNAGQVAKRALKILEGLLAQASVEELSFSPHG